MKVSLTFSFILAASVGSTVGQTLFEAVGDATGNYSTLLGLVTETGADDTIADAGGDVKEAHIVVVPFSLLAIFGPNNDAFDAINDTVANLTQQQLFDVLAGHVVNGTYNSSAVMEAGCVELETLNGTMLSVSYNNATSSVVVNNATVVEANITGEGGIFYGIDTVIFPDTFTPCPVSIFELAAAAGKYGTLLTAVVNTEGVVAAIEANEPVTVFGPTDDAFAALGSEFTDLAANEAELLKVLSGHVVSGTYNSSAVMAEGCVELETLAGNMIKIEYDENHNHNMRRGLDEEDGHDGMFMVNGIHVVEPDIVAPDGVFHGIDGVILPESFTPCPTSPPAGDSGDSAASVVDASIAMIVSVVAFAL
eukprot:scaffold3886_cov78-Cylindrotheca_fusiformis.AAC.1